ncbi:MAG: hypothetical protein ACFCVH_18510 [Alphaproteobacteria bacterium]
MRLYRVEQASDENVPHLALISNMAVEPDEAMRRMIARFVATGRLVPPSYLKLVGSSPRDTYDQLRRLVDDYAEIDNNVGRDAAKPVLEEAGDILAGVELRLERDGGTGAGFRPEAVREDEARGLGAEVAPPGPRAPPDQPSVGN